VPRRQAGTAAATSGPLVIVAAHNEANRIGHTLEALSDAFPEAAVWVADDASRDGTAGIATEEGASVVSQARSLGKGTSVTLTASTALDQAPSPGVVLLCDADLGASARELRRLVEAVEGGECDLAVGAFRDRVGGGFGIALGFARWAIQRRCGYRAKAPISGQRAMPGDVLRGVLPFAKGYGMEAAMTIDAVRAGHRVQEIDLDLEHRATGRSLAGFAHRGRQLIDIARAYRSRR
jgi:glycosyltransferase involved in cell wall biosynthesis